MAKREFSKVSPAIWRSKRFLALPSDRARLLLLYFLTSQHQNSAGAYRVPDGYAVADLGWTLTDYQDARADLCEAGLIVFDTDTEEVFCNGWFSVCPPMNDKHASGTMTRIADIESDTVREVVEVEFTGMNKARLVTSIRAREGIPDVR